MLAYVGLGSNLGRRLDAIREALRRLDREPGVRVVRRSRVRETEPWGLAGQPRFLNAVAELETDLGPAALLRRLQAIERRMGRVRVKGRRWGPRTIDLDLLVHGAEERTSARLALPHPRLAERAFVLVPLAELAPGLRVPGTGRTVGGLLAALERNGA